MQDEICYKKSFLKEVILRLDFGTPIDTFRRTLPPKLAAKALHTFPIAEQLKGRTHTVQISNEGVNSAHEEDSMQWLYHGRNREKTLTIVPEWLGISHRQYESYEKLKLDIDPVIDALFGSQKEFAVARVGLRYVNVIDNPDVDPLSWSDYILPELVSTIETFKGGGDLARSFQIVEFNDNGHQTKLQFGLVNPDYPALVKRRHFIIDIDSFYQGALDREEVDSSIKSAHEKIQKLFEKCITDKTRKLMEPVTYAE